MASHNTPQRNRAGGWISLLLPACVLGLVLAAGNASSAVAVPPHSWAIGMTAIAFFLLVWGLERRREEFSDEREDALQKERKPEGPPNGAERDGSPLKGGTVPDFVFPTVVALIAGLGAGHLLLFSGFPYTHDAGSHTWALHGLYRALSSGGGISRWVPDVGPGMPLWMHYGPLSHLPGLALMALGLKTPDAYKFSLLFCLVATAFTMYGAALRVTGRRSAAAIGALAVSFAPYHMLDTNYRGALGECIGFIALPLFLEAVYAMVTTASVRAAGSSMAPIDAAGISSSGTNGAPSSGAGEVFDGSSARGYRSARRRLFIATLWLSLSHPMSLFMAGVAGGLICLLVWARQRGLPRLGWLLPIVGAMALAGYWLVPAVLELPTTSVQTLYEVRPPSFGEHGLSLEELLSRRPWYGRLPSYAASEVPPGSPLEMPFYFGLTFVVAMLGLALFRRGMDNQPTSMAPSLAQSEQRQASERCWILLTLLLLLLTWIPFARRIAGWPFFPDVMYSWRFLGVASVSGAMIVALLSTRLSCFVESRAPSLRLLPLFTLVAMLLVDFFPYTGAPDWVPDYSGAVFFHRDAARAKKNPLFLASRIPVRLPTEGLSRARVAGLEFPPSRPEIGLALARGTLHEYFNPKIHQWLAEPKDRLEAAQRSGSIWAFAAGAPGPIAVENPRPFARLESGDREVVLLKERPDENARFEVPLPPNHGEGLLHVLEQQAPGWKVSIDEAPSVTAEADEEGFMAVTVPARASKVTFHYGLTTFPRQAGAGLSAMTALLLLLGLLGRWRRARRSAQGLDPSGQNAQGLDPSGQNAQGLDPSGQNAQGLDPSGQNAQGLDPSGQNAQGLDPSGTHQPRTHVSTVTRMARGLRRIILELQQLPPPWLDSLLVLLTASVAIGFRLQAGSLENGTDAIYATAIRDILTRGDWLAPSVHGSPYLMKPPLFFWAGAISAKLFGLNEFALRLPSALGMLVGILATCSIGARLGGRRVAWLAAGLLLCCAPYFEYSRRVYMDSLLVGLVAASVAAYLKGPEKPSWYWVGGLLTGLAIMTKSYAGLFGLLAFGGYALFFQRRVLKEWRFWGSLALAGLLVVPWIWIELAEHRQIFLEQTLEVFRLGNEKQFSWHPTRQYFYVLEMWERAPIFSLATLLGATLVINRLRDGGRAWLLPLLWMLGPLALYWSLTQQRLYYLLPILPAAALLGAFAVDRMVPRTSPSSTLIAPLFLLFLVNAGPSVALEGQVENPSPGLEEIATIAGNVIPDNVELYVWNDFFAAPEFYSGRRAIQLSPSSSLVEEIGRILVVGHLGIARFVQAPTGLWSSYEEARASGAPWFLIIRASELTRLAPGLGECRVVAQSRGVFLLSARATGRPGESLLSESPAEQESYVAAARFLAGRGAFSRAADLLIRCAKVHPGKAEELLPIARKLFERASEAEQAELLERADEAEQAELLERADEPEQGELLERTYKPKQAELLERADEPERTEFLEKTGEPERAKKLLAPRHLNKSPVSNSK